MHHWLAYFEMQSTQGNKRWFLKRCEAASYSTEAERTSRIEGFNSDYSDLEDTVTIRLLHHAPDIISSFSDKNPEGKLDARRKSFPASVEACLMQLFAANNNIAL